MLCSPLFKALFSGAAGHRPSQRSKLARSRKREELLFGPLKRFSVPLFGLLFRLKEADTQGLVFSNLERIELNKPWLIAENRQKNVLRSSDRFFQELGLYLDAA